MNRVSIVYRDKIMDDMEVTFCPNEGDEILVKQRVHQLGEEGVYLALKVKKITHKVDLGDGVRVMKTLIFLEDLPKVVYGKPLSNTKMRIQRMNEIIASMAEDNNPSFEGVGGDYIFSIKKRKKK